MTFDLNDALPQGDAPAATAFSRPEPADVIGQFEDAMAARGLVPPKRGIVADGKIHRCDTTEKSGKGDGAYCLHLDRFPAGWFQNHQDGIGPETWCASRTETLTPAERKALKALQRKQAKEREAQLAKVRAEAAQTARSIWAACPAAPDDHPYLVLKGVPSYGLRLNGSDLVVPVVQADGAISSVQTVNEDGTRKRFLPGGAKQGGFYPIGDFTSAPKVLALCEGYATAATVHRATGYPCLVAFDGGNLVHVAKVMRTQFPGAVIVICADDDWKTEGNPGIEHATAAAKAVGGVVVCPAFPDGVERGTDFNDLETALGADKGSAEVKRQIEAVAGAAAGKEQPEADTRRSPRMLPGPDNPMACARRLVGEEFGHPVMPTLIEQGGQFYRWDGTCWPAHDERDVRTLAYFFTEHATFIGKEGREPWHPSRRKISDLVEALRAVAAIPTATLSPSWLRPGDGPASEFIACVNGIVHVPTRTLIPHTPAFYVHHSLPYAFDPDAPEPAAWLAFLKSLWADDPEAISCLQELFGYIAAGGTEMQKMFLLVGPKRGGKGTIARVLKALVGAHNTAGPTLSSLATQFGMECLIGKPLGIISDARLGGGDNSIVTERLLSISGEDTLNVDRKHRTSVTLQLPTRFVVLTNELPRFSDASGALASRFIVLTLSNSFYGREDVGLTQKLLAELPGIFNWSLIGAERLKERGRFKVPASSEESVRLMEDLSSPITAFVRDRCVIRQGAEVVVDALYEEWKLWCVAQGQKISTVQMFGRNLRSAYPALKVEQPSQKGRRHRAYLGIEKKPDKAADEAAVDLN